MQEAFGLKPMLDIILTGIGFILAGIVGFITYIFNKIMSNEKAIIIHSEEVKTLQKEVYKLAVENKEDYKNIEVKITDLSRQISDNQIALIHTILANIKGNNDESNR